MKELSLHILDIMQNSIVAGADNIQLSIVEDAENDVLMFSVKDDGKGMSEDMVKAVVDPFVTGRTTRKVGMGIPLLKNAAESTGGKIELTSREGVGTEITAYFGYSHIDRQPLGNVAETMLGVITSYENVNFVYSHKVGDKEFKFDTHEIKDILGGVSFSQPEVYMWLSDFLKENESELYS